MTTRAWFVYGSLVAVLAAFACLLLRHHLQETHEVEKQSLLLGVCIPTALANLEQRTFVGKTWGGLDDSLWLEADDYDRTVVLRFLVGNDTCDLRPSNRVDEFDCREWAPVHLPDYNMDFEAFSVSGTPLSGPVTSRLSIQVLHPVAIRRIGIKETIRLSEHPLTLSGFKDADEEELLSVKFSASDPGVVHQGYRYQPVEPVSLPKGTWLELTLSSDDDQVDVLSLLNLSLSGPYSTIRQQHNVQYNVGPNVLLVEGMRQDGTTLRLGNASLNSLVSFMYTVEEVATLMKHIEDREKEDPDWDYKVLTERVRFRSEAAKDSSNILLLDGADHYRSLPDKILQCHSWFAEHYKAAHILKTDDDTYVDLPRILKMLQSEPLTGNTWWGNFRHDWTVERWGKWREPDYPAPVYPSFACGSGYIVSRSVHLWLAENAKHLHRYQGEDVSMGIWMASLAPQRLHDPRWKCSKAECQNDMLSMPDLTPKEIEAFGDNRRFCGTLCSSCQNRKFDPTRWE